MYTVRTTRREFLGKSLVTGIGIAAGIRAASLGGVAKADYDPNTITSTVGLTKGADRADNAFRALQLFKNQIAAAIGTRRVVIKPNFVWYSTSLACTRVEHMDGILEFLKSIGKRDVVIAESSAQGDSMAGFEAMGYWRLTKKYPVKLMDLDQEGFSNAQIWNSGNAGDSTLNTIRVSKLYLNPGNFIISAAPLKTHNTAVVTLATKNIAMSAPRYDIGKSWNQAGTIADKSTMHGPLGAPSGTTGAGYDYQVLNDNVYRMVKVYGIRPHLAVLDGYQGMEHNGPVSGTAIGTPQKLAVASLDFLAADRIGLALMGKNVFVQLNTPMSLNLSPTDSHPMPFPACLNYLWQAGLGEWDDRKIQVIGDMGAMKGDAITAMGNTTPATYPVYSFAAHDYQTNGYETAGIRTSPRD